VDLIGSGVPTGTVATASSSYSDTSADGSIIDGGMTYGPGLAVDGDPATAWNSGDFTGSITLTFPTPIPIAAIRLHVEALPVTEEIYTVSTSTSTTPLGTATRTVTLWPGSVVPDIQITPGTYSDITLTLNGGDSWAGIDELWLLAAPACP
jgi:hypothetical protein